MYQCPLRNARHAAVATHPIDDRGKGCGCQRLLGAQELAAVEVHATGGIQIQVLGLDLVLCPRNIYVGEPTPCDTV